MLRHAEELRRGMRHALEIKFSSISQYVYTLPIVKKFNFFYLLYFI